MSDQKAKRAFVQQRDNAKRRGIPWEITFADWWEIWQDSGHWSDRGRGAGKYCMARINDTGPYAADNVSIILQSKNSEDAQRFRRYLQGPSSALIGAE